MPIEFFISALVTLVVVVDPIGLVPSYLAITRACPNAPDAALHSVRR